MHISISHNSSSQTSKTVPDFPMVCFQSGALVYEEALINGQYLGVGWSAMGRQNTHGQVWQSFKDGQMQWRPLRSRQHAFYIQTDGQLLLDHWEWISEEEIKTEEAAIRECVITLKHLLRPIIVKIYTRLDGSHFITRWLEITNTGNKNAACAEALSWSGLVWTVGDVVNNPLLTDNPFVLGRFRNTEWSTEGEFDWENIPEGKLGIEHLHGLSGHGCPFFVIRNKMTGESLVGHIEWSGNWQMEFYNDHERGRGLVSADLCPVYRQPVRDARLYVRLGIAGPAPIRIILPGQSLKTPPVHLGYMMGDIDKCTQNLHDHLRKSVIPCVSPKKRMLVEYNHSGTTCNAQIKSETLLEDIEIAAKAGCELFMVDAGWFGDSANVKNKADEDWRELVGDWDESPLLSGRLKKVFNSAREHGLLCGLWAEIERIGSASNILKKHPDWQMQRKGEAIPQLDLTKPVVANFVEETITRLVEKYQLDCFRIDYNICIGEGSERITDGYNESTMWEYYDVLYGIMDRIKKKFPELLLENCASGGGRNDLGMLSRFNWAQLSDNSSPIRAIKILNGMTLALAPEQCLTWLGFLSKGVADIDFMLRIGLFQHIGLSGLGLSAADYNDTFLKRVRHTIDLYKRFVRPIIPNCQVFHHTPIQSHTELGEWCVLEYTDSNRLSGYAGIFRLSAASDNTFQLRLRGIDISRLYRVTFDNSGSICEFSGSDIMNNGINVYVQGGAMSEFILFEAV